MYRAHHSSSVFLSVKRRERHASPLLIARSTRRNVLAIAAGLTAGDVNARHGPVRAAAITAKDVDLDSVGVNRASDVLEGDVGDGNTVGGSTSGVTVLVVLLNDDTVVGDTGELDVGVGDVLDSTSSVVDGLDANTVLRVGDSRVDESDVLDGVVVAATDGADGETVTAGAGTAGEVDVLTRVDGDAVVLVLDGGAGDGDVGTLADVETVGVVTALGVTVAVVDGDVLDHEVVRLDGDGLDGGVLDVKTGDLGVVEVVGVEELGLGLAAVGSLTVPPLGAVAVEDGVGGLGHGDVLTGDTEKGSIPLLVLPGGGSLEGDLECLLGLGLLLGLGGDAYGGAVVEVLQVKGLTSRDGDVLEDDVGARGLALGGGGRISEGAGGPLGEVGDAGRRRSSQSGTGQGRKAEQRLGRRHSCELDGYLINRVNERLGQF